MTRTHSRSSIPSFSVWLAPPRAFLMRSVDDPCSSPFVRYFPICPCVLPFQCKVYTYSLGVSASSSIATYSHEGGRVASTRLPTTYLARLTYNPMDDHNLRSNLEAQATPLLSNSQPLTAEMQRQLLAEFMSSLPVNPINEEYVFASQSLLPVH